MRLRPSEPTRLLPPGEEVSTDVGPLLLPAADGVMRPMMAATGDWEINEATIFRTYLQRGTTVVDVGAHVGYYTLMAARGIGRRGRVIALEPDPDNAALLMENVRRSGLRNVTVIQAAGWRETTRLTLTRNSANTGDNRVAATEIGPEAGDSAQCEVEAIALDERLQDMPVTLVKTDAQGVDHLALQGMRDTLLRRQPVVFTEFWPEAIRDAGDEPAAVIDQYRELGYRITVIGFDADFAQWTSRDIASAVEGFPFGAAALVLRPHANDS